MLLADKAAIITGGAKGMVLRYSAQIRRGRGRIKRKGRSPRSDNTKNAP
jgi:hypothetical protein